MEFEQIYNTYFKAVYRYIWQLSSNEHIAEKLQAKHFLGNEIHKFSCDNSVWLCQITKKYLFPHI